MVPGWLYCEIQLLQEQPMQSDRGRQSSESRVISSKSNQKKTCRSQLVWLYCYPSIHYKSVTSQSLILFPAKMPPIDDLLNSPRKSLPLLELRLWGPTAPQRQMSAQWVLQGLSGFVSYLVALISFHLASWAYCLCTKSAAGRQLGAAGCRTHKSCAASRGQTDRVRAHHTM